MRGGRIVCRHPFCGRYGGSNFFSLFTYQVFFYSMKTNSWTSLKQDVEIVNGQAVIDIGVDTSNGYLYIRSVTTPESDFVELYVE